jgi:hypothetical protein
VLLYGPKVASKSLVAEALRGSTTSRTSTRTPVVLDLLADGREPHPHDDMRDLT